MLLCGSVGNRSCTRTFLRHLEGLLKEKNVGTIWWDLGVKPLPIAVPEYYNQPENNPKVQVRKFVQAIRQADGFILASPLYHGSYSGVLKNALDNLPPDAFRHKPVSLVSHSSNARSCVTPCNDLRPIVRALSGYATQMQIGTTDFDYKDISGQLSLVNEKIKNRSKILVEELTNLSAILKTQQIIKSITIAPSNF